MSPVTTPLSRAATTLLSGHRGVLGVDEHLDRIPATVTSAVHRRMLLGTAGLSRSLNGVVVAPEGIDDAVSLLATRDEDSGGHTPQVGVSLDNRVEPLSNAQDDNAPAQAERISSILDAVRSRGATFVKWRADLDPLRAQGDPAYVDTPFLALGATLSQDLGLLPILDVAMPNQRTHGLGVAIAVTGNALRRLYADLSGRGIDLTAVIVRMNTVRAGELHHEQTTPEEAASATLRIVNECVPAQAPGVLFMSTGLETVAACADLAAIARRAAANETPFPLSFAWGRALVAPATAAWVHGGAAAGQEALSEACRSAVQACGSGAGIPARCP